MSLANYSQCQLLTTTAQCLLQHCSEVGCEVLYVVIRFNLIYASGGTAMLGKQKLEDWGWCPRK